MSPHRSNHALLPFLWRCPRGGEADSDAFRGHALMAVQARFCGICGAQVPPGAPFCGRCGSPQAPLPVATMPAYAYPAAPPRQATGVRRAGGSQIAVAVGLLIILAAVTVGVSSFVASQVIGGTHKPCTSNCGARIVTPLAA